MKHFNKIFIMLFILVLLNPYSTEAIEKYDCTITADLPDGATDSYYAIVYDYETDDEMGTLLFSANNNYTDSCKLPAGEYYFGDGGILNDTSGRFYVDSTSFSIPDDKRVNCVFHSLKTTLVESYGDQLESAIQTTPDETLQTSAEENYKAGISGIKKMVLSILIAALAVGVIYFTLKKKKKK